MDEDTSWAMVLGFLHWIVFLMILFPLGCASPRLKGSVDAGYVLSASAVTTPGGTTYDGPPGGILVVDRIVDEVSECLDVDVSGLSVKIAADWIYNCDATQQMLPTLAGGGDPNKHFDADACSGASWHWRALYEPDGLIVSTPSMYDIKDPIVRLVTGNQAIWVDPHLATCAAPSTGPLDLF